MRRRHQGYTLVEILTVVAIVALLASISVPAYMQFVRKPRAAEAVATMALMRQALRDYRIVHSAYFDVGSGNMPNALPTSVSGATPSPSTAGLAIDVGVVQYFSNAAYSVNASNPVSARFTTPGPVDFIISVDGSASVACGTSNCAINKNVAANYRLEMDNSGRTFVSYDAGSHWQTY